jgi:formylmethanofuran dehydrogenase subunit E
MKKNQNTPEKQEINISYQCECCKALVTKEASYTAYGARFCKPCFDDVTT